MHAVRPLNPRGPQNQMAQQRPGRRPCRTHTGCACWWGCRWPLWWPSCASWRCPASARTSLPGSLAVSVLVPAGQWEHYAGHQWRCSSPQASPPWNAFLLMLKTLSSRPPNTFKGERTRMMESINVVQWIELVDLIEFVWHTIKVPQDSYLWKKSLLVEIALFLLPIQVYKHANRKTIEVNEKLTFRRQTLLGLQMCPFLHGIDRRLLFQTSHSTLLELSMMCMFERPILTWRGLKTHMGFITPLWCVYCNALTSLMGTL